MEIQTIKNLPTIQELFSNPELQFKRETLNHYLNQDPPKEWVKTHPFIKNYKYLPIDKVEFLLKKFFKAYKIERIHTGVLFNSIEACFRVNYLDPITDEWMYHDGVGAKELQTASGTGVLKMDFSNVNKSAVEMALPIAKTVAIKDACDHFGNIFGANLNRKDTIQGFNVDENLAKLVLTKEEERLERLIDKADTLEYLEDLRPHLTENLQTLFYIKWKKLEQELVLEDLKCLKKL